MLKYLFIGTLSALGFAPFNFILISIICLAWLYNELKFSKYTYNIKLIFLFSMGYHIGMLHWLYMPFVIDGSFGILTILLAIISATTFLSISFLLTATITRIFNFSGFIFASAAIFSEYFVYEILSEILIETPFPWCYIGHILNDQCYINQVAYLFKIYGLSFIVYYTSALLANFCSTKNIMCLKILISLYASLFSYSLYRIAFTPVYDFKKLSFLMVQPNIKQTSHWNYDKISRYVSHLANLSTNTDKNIIWPESCLPYIFSNNKNLLSNHIAKVLSPERYLIMGMIYTENNKFYNSFGVIDDSGRIIERYDKVKLAPFGEFTPLKKFTPIKLLLGDKNEYSKGKYHKTIHLKNMPIFMPLICYEIVFPNIDTQDAELIINITNDGWFGNTAAPYQHLAIAKIRAIESNIPILRVANTGISAVIDNFGRTVAKINLNKTGIISF